MSDTPSRRSGLLFWLCFLPIFALTLLIFWKFSRPKEEEPVLTQGGFDIPEAPKTEDLRRSGSFRGPQVSNAPAMTPIARGYLGSASRPQGSPQEEAARQKEDAFLSKYGGIVHGVDMKIQGSIRKYSKKYPVINRFSNDYNQMTRLRGVYKQYAKDGDFYQYVRSASALPETKQLITKYASNPDAWKAGFAVTLDVLKNPPPPAVYTELLKTLMADRIASKNTTELMSPIINNFPAMSVQAVPAGADMAPIQGFFGDATGGGALGGNSALVSSDYNNSYWAGFQVGYQEGVSRGKK